MRILGVRIDNVTMAEALEKIRGFLNDDQQHQIVTLNPDFLVLAQKDKEFRDILNRADLSVPDGTGLILASWLAGERLKEKVVGIDLIENCKLKIVNLKVFLLGGFNGAAEKIAKDWPAVVGFSEDTEGMELFARIREYQPNLLLVALGAPKQEKWIAQNLAKIPTVKVAIGVGSAFNILSGQIKRAPKIFQALGLEWLWRVFREPHRWRKVWRSVVVFPFLV
ncbi:WecB/TagA/CpsF family glycosyltransferase, partial [Patescibacteria group bacterium]|nr:WecB/TagA/CpsF family glycosyltransferase [Patescibacteria group bacterium]